MKATFQSDYPKKTKSGLWVQMFIYLVSGTDSELAQYQQDQGDYFTVDDVTGKPLFFTTKFGGMSVNLKRSTKGNYYIEMTEFTTMANLASQFGGNLGVSLANKQAERLLDNMFNKPVAGTTVPTAEPTIPADSPAHAGAATGEVIEQVNPADFNNM